ncbi:DUF971 domain-containing protein [Vitiosangium sp. GDMCC 1.1324]|uniref:DUF971 domain-containing protein n=1 Tax=Vitiosangium sp. (strain GDMCC 1.1324) TaxID=2138576 RepID=UPI000D3D1745|nr:DUF971 domain-containing protein [Vitiosangium sp. GDMCC 1.1324]PTL77885.1 DUF971 domain-containing protein [Vitiosangium sp. GDMCC 1.1324]
MSFWDRIKPTTRPVSATEAALSPDGAQLALTWEDGVKTDATAQHLRQQCPCAGCVDEWTNKRTLDPSRVPADLRITQVQPVGNYALTFVFSDGHATGIYPWKLLRDITQSQG